MAVCLGKGAEPGAESRWARGKDTCNQDKIWDKNQSPHPMMGCHSPSPSSLSVNYLPGQQGAGRSPERGRGQPPSNPGLSIGTVF